MVLLENLVPASSICSECGAGKEMRQKGFCLSYPKSHLWMPQYTEDKCCPCQDLSAPWKGLLPHSLTLWRLAWGFLPILPAAGRCPETPSAPDRGRFGSCHVPEMSWVSGTVPRHFVFLCHLTVSTTVLPWVSTQLVFHLEMLWIYLAVLSS